MSVIHNIGRDLAQQLLAGQKAGRVPEHLAQLVAQEVSPRDPNLPLVEAQPGATTSQSHTVQAVHPPLSQAQTGSHFAGVDSDMTDGDKTALTAMTRAATMNLRLHSQDISDQEKGLAPPHHTLSVFEKTGNVLPLDPAFSALTYSLDPGKQPVFTSQALHTLDPSIQPGTSLGAIQLPGDMHTNTLPMISVPDGFHYQNPLLTTANMHLLMGRPQLTFDPGCPQLREAEQRAIESLQRLQENTHQQPASIGTTADHVTVSQGHMVQARPITGSEPTPAYRIHNLF